VTFEWLWIPAVLVGYVLLTRWVLPRLGVPTCTRSRERTEDRSDPEHRKAARRRL
jgi:hypothetical protein